jgi:alpha-L-rhamnosidase
MPTARCASGCSKAWPGVAPVAEKRPGFDEVALDPLILPALSPVRPGTTAATAGSRPAWALEGDRVTYRVTLPQGCTGG